MIVLKRLEETSEQQARMINDYFPYSIFSTGKPASKFPFDIFSKYEITGYFLDILLMERQKETNGFKYLFPSKAGEIPGELMELGAELEEKKKICERLNVIDFFLKKRDKEFIANLNIALLGGVKENEGTLLYFFKQKLGEENFWEYSYEQKEGKGNLKGNVSWKLPGFNFSHKYASVYYAFVYYARKNCTLYLIGSDFAKFKECREDWPKLQDRTSLPAYFSSSKDNYNELEPKFAEKNAGDFLWGRSKDQKKYTKTLLEKFGLNNEVGLVNAGLKAFFFSFCTPIIKNTDSVKNEERYSTHIKYGKEIIDNTFNRNPKKVKWIGLKLFINKYLKKEGFEKGDEEKEARLRFAIAWERLINYCLEGKIDNKYYHPATFETIARRISGAYKGVFNEAANLKAQEDGDLAHNDRVKIYQYWKNLREFAKEFSEDDWEKLAALLVADGHRERLVKPFSVAQIDSISDITDYEKIKVLYGFNRRFSNKKSATIKALYSKAFLGKTPKPRKIPKDGDSEKEEDIPYEDLNWLGNIDMETLMNAFKLEFTPFRYKEYFNFDKGAASRFIEEIGKEVFDHVREELEKYNSRLSKEKLLEMFCSVFGIGGDKQNTAKDLFDGLYSRLSKEYSLEIFCNVLGKDGNEKGVKDLFDSLKEYRRLSKSEQSDDEKKETLLRMLCDVLGKDDNKKQDVQRLFNILLYSLSDDKKKKEELLEIFCDVLGKDSNDEKVKKLFDGLWKYIRRQKHKLSNDKKNRLFIEFCTVLDVDNKKKLVAKALFNGLSKRKLPNSTNSRLFESFCGALDIGDNKKKLGKIHTVFAGKMRNVLKRLEKLKLEGVL